MNEKKPLSPLRRIAAPKLPSADALHKSAAWVFALTFLLGHVIDGAEFVMFKLHLLLPVR